MLNKPNVSNIVREGTGLDFKWRLLLLSEGIHATETKELPPDIQKAIADQGTEIELRQHEVKLSYASLDYFQVLRQLLPVEVEVPQPLEKMGHIACFYLAHQQYPYRVLVAQVYMDKYPETRTVVNRRFDSEGRTIVTELLAGNPNTEVKIKEDNGVALTLDYVKSSLTGRMEEERKRILHYVNMNYTVCDLLADCGAVTVRAANKGCRVIANCEGMENFKYLEKNAAENLAEGAKMDKVKLMNMKTQDFIKLVLGPAPEVEAKVTVPEDFRRVNVVYINDYFNAFGYIKQILVEIRAQCENPLNNMWGVRNLPKIYFYYCGQEKSSKAAVVEKLKQAFVEAGCGADTFTEKCIIGIKANRYIYPDICLHCVYIRIPAAAVFSKDYMEMYGSQELSVPNPGSICSLSIGDTLELMDELKSVTQSKGLSQLAGKRVASEKGEKAAEKEEPDSKKKKEEP